MAKVEADRYETLIERMGAPIVPPTDEMNRRVAFIRKRRDSFRQFVIDAEGCKWLDENLREMSDLINQEIDFAKPPFENTYIEYRAGRVPYGMAISSDGILDTLIVKEDANMFSVPFSINYITGEIVRYQGSERMPEELKVDGEITVKSMRVWAALFFLMLHKPKTHQITERPRVSIKQKGRRKVFLAHSLVHIDILAASEEMRRTAITGARGAYRAHECRGTWVNYDRNRECDHDWQEVPSEDGIPRYFCIKCSQRRSWRKAHVRGDATLGWVRKQYTVTAKGVDQ